MKRAIIVTGATVVGLAWVITYKVSPHATGLAAAPPSPDASPAQASASPGTAPTAGATGTYTGADVPNRFGDVRVRVVVTNGRISDVQALQLPFDRAQSAYISQVAGPLLRSETLQAQSARIDIISGATYTSVSYAQSVESALQQAHLG